MSHPHNLHLVEFKALKEEYPHNTEAIWVNLSTVAMVSPGKSTWVTDEQGETCVYDQQITLLQLSNQPNRLVVGSLDETLARLNNLGTTLHQQDNQS